MNILLDVLYEVAGSIDYSRLYSSIRSKIENSVGVEKGGYPTNVWLAGITSSRGSEVGKVNRKIANLHSGNMDPDSKEYRDAVRVEIALKELSAVGLVSQDETGRYTFPQSQTAEHNRRRAQLADLRKFLTSNFHADQNASDLSKSFRDASAEAASEMLANMPPERRQVAEVYSKMSLAAYNLLVNLYTKRGPKDVARFRTTINDNKFSESINLQELQNLGLVNGEGLLNRGAVDSFMKFVNTSNNAQLMVLNKELGKVTRNAQHSRQLSLNAAGRGNGPDDEQLEPDDTQLASDMDTEEDRAINSRIRDIEGGTKSSSKNARAGGYNRTFSDMFKSNIK